MNELECNASLNAEEQNSLDVIRIIIHIVLITLLVLLSPITKLLLQHFWFPIGMVLEMALFHPLFKVVLMVTV